MSRTPTTTKWRLRRSSLLHQGIAAVLLWLGDPTFLSWILPPAAYLTLIGLLCWWRFGRRDMLALDTGRGAILLVLSLLAWSQMPGAA